MKHLLILVSSLAVLAAGGLMLRSPPLWAASHRAGPYHWSLSGAVASRALRVPTGGIHVHYQWNCVQRGNISIQDTAFDPEGEHMWDAITQSAPLRGTFTLRPLYPVHTAWLANLYVVPGTRSCRVQITVPAYNWT